MIKINNNEKLTMPENSPEYIRKNIKPRTITIYSSERNNVSIKDMEEFDISNNRLTFSGHYYIRTNGEVYKGRPDDVIGEFAYNQNKDIDLNFDNIGICLEGNFNIEFLNDVQRSVLLSLCEELRGKYSDKMRVLYLRQLDLKNNPGLLFPFGDILGTYNKTFAPDKALIGTLKFDALGSRELWLDRVTPFIGTDVYSLQIILSKLGFYNTPPTGEFDMNSRLAIMRYQISRDLVDSGIAGFRTLNRIINDMKKMNSHKIFKRVLDKEKGDIELSGLDILNLQRELNNKRYICKETGVYDKDTIESIRQFQEVNQIDMDGKVGPITWNMLFGDLNTDNFRVLMLKDEIMYGKDIKELQERLVHLGYRTPVTEKYDYLTEAQVRRYQIHNNLSATGIVDKPLWDRIFGL